MKHEELIKQMTLEEKASLMSGKTVWETQEISRLNVPSAFLSDGPSGVRKQLGSADQLGLNESVKATCFPAPVTIANSFNVEIAKLVGTTLGREGRALNVNLILAPGMNIKRNPLCGRSFEYFSEDPYLAGNIAGAYVDGIQSNGLGCCVKHFLLNNQELRRMQNDSIVDERTMREIYMTGFEIAINDHHPKAIMTAYNMVNGYFANENKHVLVDILRDEWKYEGCLVTDWGGSNDRIEGLKCYSSLEMPTTAGITNREIIKAVNEKKVDEAYLDQSVDYLLSMLDDIVYPTDEKVALDEKAGDEVVIQAARESFVLLKNDNNVLPLKPKTKVAVIGDLAISPRFQGAGSSKVNPYRVVSLCDALKATDLNIIGIEKGYKRYGGKSNSLIKSACKLASKADIVILAIGLDEYSEVEGLDRETFKIPSNQLDLLKELKKTNKNIVTVLSCGCAVDMKEINDGSTAILYTELCGQSGQIAAAEILTGKVNPSGHLSETFPLNYEDVPSSKYFPGKEATAEYRESIYVGYRYYSTKDIPVAYPFGYGLSYSHFTYSDLSVDHTGARFKITNDSDTDGKAVPQLYVSLKNSTIFRAKVELKGFTKISLKAHETQEVFLPFDERTFRYFNVKTNKFEIEGGTYTIYISTDCNTPVLEGEITLSGTTDVNPYEGLDITHYNNADITDVPTEEFEAILGHKVPESKFPRDKKGRIIVTSNTTMRDLVDAPGRTGRFFGKAVRFAIKFLKFFGARQTSNSLIQGVYNQTVKTISRMTNGFLDWEELLGLIDMFNGKFRAGFSRFNKARKEYKKFRKAEKKAKKAEKA